MTAPVRPPRTGLHTLAPEIARIVEALARVQEERDHTAGRQLPGKPAIGGGGQTPTKPEFGRSGKSRNGTTSTP